MSNEWDEMNDENPAEQGGSEGLANLRKAHERQKKQNEELRNQLAELTARERERTLSETLRTKGANPKLAAFYPANGEATPEAVEQWLNDNADVFGQAPVTRTQPAEPQVSPELRSVYENFQQPGMNTPSQDEVSAIRNYQFGDAIGGDNQAELQKFMAFVRQHPEAINNQLG